MKQRTHLKISDRHRVAIKPDGTRIPVIDSKFSFLLQPNKEDIEKGIPGDHTQCMYCVACRRLYDSDLVWVTRMLAYVELKGKGGKPVLQRFILKDPAKQNVKAFDAGDLITPEAVIFAAPTGSQTLDAQAEQWRQRGKNKKAYIQGEIEKSARSGDPRRKKAQPLSSLRDVATGRFHFSSR